MCGILCHFTTKPCAELPPNKVYTSAEIKQLVEQDLEHDLQLTPEESMKLEEYKVIKEQLKHNKFYLRDKNNKKNDKSYKKAKGGNALVCDSLEIQDLPQMAKVSLEDTPEAATETEELAYPLKHFFNELIPKIATRGPDYCQFTAESHQAGSITITAQHFSSILSLRQPFTAQPYTALTSLEHKFVLQFNGELYNNAALDVNDTEYVMQQLLALPGIQDIDSAVLNLYRSLKGEFAAVIYHKNEGVVYFMRDFIGKRSLLYSVVDGDLTVSSLPPSSECSRHRMAFRECKGGELYKYSLVSQTMTIYKIVGNGDRVMAITEERREVEGDNDMPTEEQQTNVLYERINATTCHQHSHLSYSSPSPPIQALVSKLDNVFTEAVRTRIETIHPLDEYSGNSRVKLGVLFSGGIDCTLVAHKIASLSPPGTVIDLLSVGFENPRASLSPAQSPDRVLALKSWQSLQARFAPADVTINMVEVDVTYEEWLLHKRRVMALMYPCHTEMDLSIAIAFYFASRGSGNKVVGLGEFTREAYHSRCKVLFSGLGADELYGGYTRHQKIFTSLTRDKSDVNPSRVADIAADIAACYGLLAKELLHDLNRLYVRNLGRDDRVISSWGKELRYPFLDEALIRFTVEEVPLDLKYNYQCHCSGCVSQDATECSADFKSIRKWLLRELALSYNMEYVAHEAKRAIQFGAKSAKLEIGQGKTKGSDSC
ncbi:hypothetical protein BABINDRAFT_163121 [Babjeviella inositovora NRRL Y-12698]|uniref:Glutamine amidotransferase type-2 domain-containing protein n=1 Tax=Babjeviella inositovora NRRL Y-12698 TaxID=984486 RepID=A0A1E3QK74_9ASCO|nr:uncharacterized protein BABINDRAFT_163121 [Babjeviella inositovora NRRL Y-12698]ODQ78099.1 hypothetical protein BABINDRAFT_163121 [Babjeviella inositovora NRRL Y-12698]